MKTHLDLFSGIGGFALAARWAGLETVQFVELDPFCQKVLRKNFPGVPIHDDITTYAPIWGLSQQGLRQPNIESAKQIKGDGHIQGQENRPFLLTGGFPCQPFSCAGKRRGKEDGRYLWPEMLRVVSEAKPRWIIGENVAGFISMGLDDCISDLEDQGYEVQALVIPACAVNAPHRRDRVWIVAHATFNGSGGIAGEVCETNGRQNSDLHIGIENANSNAADTGNAPASRQRRYSGEVLSKPEPIRYDHSDTWGESWLEVAARLCRVDARVSNRVDRLKSLGNAIVPQVAYEIMKSILNVEVK